jgi:hypothetical protein
MRRRAARPVVGPGAKALGLKPCQAVEREPYDLLFGELALAKSGGSTMTRSKKRCKPRQHPQGGEGT